MRKLLLFVLVVTGTIVVGFLRRSPRLKLSQLGLVNPMIRVAACGGNLEERVM